METLSVIASIRERPKASKQARAAAGTRRGPAWLWTALLGCASALLLASSFPPIGLSPAAWVAVCIWLMGLSRARSLRHASVYALLTSCIFWGASLYWVALISIAAFLGLLFVTSCYWTAMGLILRGSMRLDIPMTVACPVAWTAFEVLRGLAPFGGFPWYNLGHSAYQATHLIQIADLTGHLGVSFLLAMFNGFLFDATQTVRREGLARAIERQGTAR